jgi:hypothetical protein
MAGALLRRPGLSEDALGERFYPVMLQVIASLGEHNRETLRSQVDWVEAYESAERSVQRSR